MSALAAASYTPDDLLQEGFWRAQFPKLSIGNYFASGKFSASKPPLPLLQNTAERLREEGYFQNHDAELRKLAVNLGEAVKRCVALDIPPTFLFLFDETWACFYRQHPFIAHFLGGNYAVLPDFWVWHVDPAKGESGWKPHRDKGKLSLTPDGTPLSLTMWIPLSDATPMNSCIYVLPANCDPVYNTVDEGKWQIDYPSVRALPAKPGDVLGWTQGVLHWGSRASRFAEAPRLSMALEFQRGDIPAYNMPLLPAQENLPFALRLKLIAKQIIQYHHMYALTPQMQVIAARIVQL